MARTGRWTDQTPHYPTERFQPGQLVRDSNRFLLLGCGIGQFSRAGEGWALSGAPRSGALG